MTAGTGFSDDKYDVYRPELWTPRINRFLKEKLYAATFFLDYSSEVRGGDVVHIPHIGDVFTASDIPVTSGDVTATDISETKTDLTVDKWKGAAFFITKFEEREMMKSPRVRAEYQKAMGYRLGKQLETDLLANLKGIANIPDRAGLTTTALVATNIEFALGILASNSVMKEECRIFLNPKVYWSDLMSIQKYYDASQFGRPSVPQGAHDLLYGIPIVLTPNVAKEVGMSAFSGAIAHPTTLVHARTGVDFAVKSSEHLRSKIIADIIYGTRVMNASRAVRLLSTSV